MKTQVDSSNDKKSILLIVNNIDFFLSHRKKIGEALESQDLVQIRKLIKVVVGDILRDIWLKRAAWNK